jgi:hypothetical protein
MRLPDRHRRLLGLAAAAILLPSLLLAPDPVLGAPPTASDPRPLVLEAGPQVGLRFGPDGTVIARRRITLATQAHQIAIGRKAISGHGTRLLVGSGALSGYYVRESIVAYVKGVVGSRRFAPPAECASRGARS